MIFFSLYYEKFFIVMMKSVNLPYFYVNVKQYNQRDVNRIFVQNE